MNNILLLLIIVLLSSCGEGSENSASPSSSNDSTLTDTFTSSSGFSGASVGVYIAEPVPTGPSQSPSGIWIGNITSDMKNTSYNVVGIITEYGEARFLAVSAGMQYSGVVLSDRYIMQSEMLTYSSGDLLGGTTISGMVSTKGKIEAEYYYFSTDGSVDYFESYDRGSVVLTYDPAYERASSLSLVSGTWKADIDGQSSLISINDNGDISGSSTAGCTYSGTVSIINSSYKAYNVSLTVSNCGTFNGAYSGLSALYDTTTANNTLYAGLSNASASIVAGFIRQ